MVEATRPRAVPVRDALLGWFGAWIGGGLLSSVVILVGAGDPTTPAWLLLTAVITWVPLVGVAASLTRRANGVGVRGSFRAVDLLGLPAGVLAQVVALPLVYWPLRALWPDQFDVADIEQRARDLWDSAAGAGTVVLVAVVAVGAPLVEEYVYRGLLQRSFDARFGRWWGLLAGAVLFAGIHLQPVELPGLIVAGLVFGAGLAVTGRIGAGVMAHIGFNLAGLVLVAQR